MRVPRIVPGLLLLTCSYQAYGQWPNGYTYSGTITLQHTQVANSDQANFPVLISGTYPDLATTANGGRVTNANGYDIIFTSDANGANKLNFERELYSPSTGQVVYWVQAPNLSHTTDTVIYVFYGNSLVTTDQSNRSLTWDRNYRATYHLGESKSPYQDSTSNSNATGSFIPTAVNGKVGKAQQFSAASGQYLSAPNTVISGNSLMLEGWLNVSSPTGNPVLIDNREQGTLRGGVLYLDTAASNHAAFYINNVANIEGAVNLADGAWHHLVGTYDGTTMKLYVDGSLVKTGSGGSFAGFMGGTIYLGRAAGSSVYTNGSVDEVRVSNLARTADWIATEYNNQNTPALFYSAAWGQTPAGAPASTGLEVSSSSLTYSGTAGADNTVAQSLDITNSGSGTLNWTATATQPWITLATTADGAGASTLSGTGAQTIWILASSSGMAPGLYTGSVTISATGAIGSPSTVNVSLTVYAPPPSTSWPNGYSYSGKFTVAHTQVANTDQANFPVLIAGTYPELSVGKVTSLNGYDIIFTSDANGLNKLNFERELYSPSTGQVVYWVQVPNLSHTTDTVIYVFYGNSLVTADQSNRSLTWDRNYRATYHLGESKSPYQDSTSNSNATGSFIPTAVNGKVGKAQQFSAASGQYLSAPNTVISGNSLMLEGWLNVSSPTGNPVLIDNREQGTLRGGVLYLDTAASNHAAFYINNVANIEGTVNLADGAWHHLVGTYDGTTMKLYVDGSLVKTGSGGSFAGFMGGTIYLGRAAGSSVYTNGSVDEVRVSNVARSADWVATEYSNQNNPASFYSVVWGQTLTVVSPVSPGLSVSSSSLTYSGQAGSSNPPAQSVNITNSGVGTLSWTATAAQPWITLATTANGVGASTLSGTGAQTIWIQVASNGLAPGPNSGAVNIAAPGAMPSSQSVNIFLALATINDPVGYWTFDAGTIAGTTILDSSPDRFNGTLTGGATPTTGIINQALSFNGGSSGIAFPAESLTDLTGNLSLALWVKTSNNASLQSLISRYSAAGLKYGYLLRTTPAGHVELRVGGNNNSAGTGVNLTDTGSLINDGLWHHVAAVISVGHGVSFYIDGSPSSTVSWNIIARSGGYPLQIGSNNYAPYGVSLVGSLDDVRIYNRALQPFEIAILANSAAIIASPPPPPPSVLSASPLSLSFTAAAGSSNPLSQPVTISNSGGGTLNWTAVSSQSWMTVSTTSSGGGIQTLSGTGPQTIWIQVASSSLLPGPYSATVNISVPGSTPPSQAVNVSLAVTSPTTPSLSVAPSNLFFSATPGSSRTIAQSLKISNSGGGTLNWTATANQPWITLSSTSGTGSQILAVGTSVAGLTAGTYTGSVTISAPDAAVSVQNIGVSLAIVPALTPPTNGQAPLYNGIVLPQQWPPVGTASQAYSIPFYITSPPAVIPIDVGRQLFVDDFLIQQTTLARTQHQPVMYAGNPIITPAGSDTAGLALPFSNGAWFDPSDSLFKIWYYCGSGNVTCYAYSTDGRNWTKPSIPDAMVPNTNQVLPNPGNDSSVVWMDLQDPNPAHKFKAFAFQGPSNMAVYFSGDGIHWTAQQTQYSIQSLSDRTTLFWNPFRNLWVDSMRNQVQVPGTQNRAPYPADRVRYYAESPDLLSWKPSNFTDSFWTGADENDPAYVAGGALPQLYNLDAVAYESTLVGLFSWLNPGPADPVNDPTNAAGPALVELGVGFSRDGFNWVRPNRGGGPSNALIPASNVPGSWNMGNTQSTGGGFLVVGDELWFYFSGRNGPHGHETGGSTGLATLRRDGFYSMDAGSTQGVLVTRPVKFTGKYLFVNVKDPQGSLQAEILDANGNVISPFTAQNSIALSVDSTLQQITWSGVSDLSSLIGQNVQFRFYLTNGELYSFWVSPT